MRDELTTISIRFHGRLNDFLRERQQDRVLKYQADGRPGLLDVVQALGVPHAEAGDVRAGARKVSLSYRIKEGDRISVRPRRDRSRARPAFILDVHLGRLARYLRLFGFDCLYDNACEDARIAELAAVSGRIVLTRDVGLLKRGRIKKGYWLRSTDAEEQAKEVMERFGIIRFARPFSRCLACNGNLRDAAKEEVVDQLPPSARQNQDKFRRCETCRKIYWKGSHFKRLGDVILFARGEEDSAAQPAREKAS